MLVAAALVVGLALGGLGIANAASRTAQAAAAGQTLMGATSPLATLSNLTGLSVQEIGALRAQGKSLSAIAAENGVDPAVVVDQTVAARQTYFDGLVAAGTMTAAQEQTALVRIRAVVQTMMDAVPGSGQVPSRATTATPSVPTTFGAGPAYLCPTPRAGVPASGTVGPRSGSTSRTTAGWPCTTNAPRVAPAPAPTAQNAPTTNQGVTAGPTGATTSAPTAPSGTADSWSGRMGRSGAGSTTGTSGAGRCGW